MHPKMHRTSPMIDASDFLQKASEKPTVDTTVCPPKNRQKKTPPQTIPEPFHAPPSCTSRTLAAIARDFLAKVHRECAEELARDPKTLRASILRLVRRELPLRRGRPNDPRIDAAVRMLEQGKSVKEILRLQTRGFDKLDTYGRYLADKGLRAAITRRRKRARNRPHPTNTV